MPEQSFPLPGSSYKELIKIIQGYDQVGENAVPADVASAVAVHETIVSGNNRFLVEIGIVQGGKKKTITSVGAELSRALEHNVVDQIAVKWRSLAESNEFLNKIVGAVRIRKGMDETSLQTHIAYSAGQPKTPRALTGASTIIDILKVAGLLTEDGGNLIAPPAEPLKVEDSDTFAPTNAQKVVGALIRRSTTPSLAGTVQINIDVRIQCTPQDLNDLGQKLKKLVEDFNRQESTPQGAND